MNFKELLAALTNPPEEGNPESIYSDLGNAYDAESAGWVENTTGLEAQVAELTKANIELTAVNATLMLLVGQEATEETGADSEANDDDEIEDEGDDEGHDPYDALFDEDDKDKE